MQTSLSTEWATNELRSPTSGYKYETHAPLTGTSAACALVAPEVTSAGQVAQGTFSARCDLIPCVSEREQDSQNRGEHCIWRVVSSNAHLCQIGRPHTFPAGVSSSSACLDA